MDKKLQIEAMARLDGYSCVKRDGWWWGRRGETGVVRFKDLPNYHTDNEIDRMVRGLGVIEVNIYLSHLSRFFISATEADRTQATEEQKVEAFLRTHGEWTE